MPLENMKCDDLSVRIICCFQKFLQQFKYMSNKTVKNDGIIEKPVEATIEKDCKDVDNKKNTNVTNNIIVSTIFDVPQPKLFSEMEYKCQKTKEFLMWINGEFETEENKLKRRKLEEV